MLVELSVIEQRYHAVLAVLGGESAVSVAAQVGVSRQRLACNWLPTCDLCKQASRRLCRPQAPAADATGHARDGLAFGPSNIARGVRQVGV